MSGEQQDAHEPARWQRATLPMIDMLPVDGLFDNNMSVNASDLGDALYGKLKVIGDDAPERPLIEMLASIFRMHETPTKTPPFGPMVVMADGSRSAAPDDFAGPLVEVIVAVLERIEHPVARARLAHLAWFLERRRRNEGLVALRAYIDIIERLDDGRLEARGERGILGVTGRDLLRMAFAVCHGLGRPAGEHDRLQELAAGLLRRVGGSDDGFSLRLFTDLALDERAVPPEDVAGIVETFIERTAPAPSAGSDDYPAQMWLLAARAHKRAKDENAANAAMIRAAECYAAHAETFVGRPHGAMLATHWMETAIATLHGVPGIRERRQKLRHRLIDMQGAIREDLVPISHSTDISELVEEVRAKFLGLPLGDALRRLTLIAGSSPEPEKLAEEARRSSVEHPFSSFFAASHMDAEGKTIARSPSGGIGVEDATAESLEPTIMQAESTRRAFAARAGIDVARVVIIAEHRVS
ncbi:DUF7380 domain-containing protein [Salipiger thiooxidans]